MRHARDEEHEARIRGENIVDAYTPDEQALGWYYYLKSALGFPFTARCIAERTTSPLQIGDEIEVVSMPPEEDCEHTMIVLTRWGHGRTLGVPLAQLEGVGVDEDTAEAIADWHYWLEQGHRLS